MISDTIKEIETYQSKIDALQKKVQSERQKELATLHSKMGYGSRAELIAALRQLDKGRGGRRGRPAAKKAAKKAGARKATKRGKRVKVTDELRGKILEALKGGVKGTQAAKDFGVSVPTIHNIKKSAGLTKSRK